MLPGCSADSAAEEDAATTTLLSLPLPLIRHIFSLLPVDCRLRCSEVCRDWRGVLLERSLWTRLDLTRAGGLRERAGEDLYYRGTWNALLRCAAARAGGGLQSLHISRSFVTQDALLEVVASNASALRELHVNDDPEHLIGLSAGEVSALLGAAPLDVLVTDLCEYMDTQAACRALRNEAPFGPLRVPYLYAYLEEDHAVTVAALAADAALHAPLRGLTFSRAPLHVVAALDAVVDAALTRRMHTVTLDNCGLSPASAPALARLLGCSALTALECEGMDLLDAPASAVLAAALHGNSTLTSLALKSAGVFRDAAAAAELLGALTGQPSLQMLCLSENYVAEADRAAVGALVGALVAADAPALTHMDVSRCNCGEDGLRPLFEALPHNAHLRELDCSHNDISEAFARDVLLPAVRANASLRKLATGPESPASAAEAAAIVSRRAAA
jgi:hypothetical protein